MKIGNAANDDDFIYTLDGKQMMTNVNSEKKSRCKSKQEINFQRAYLRLYKVRK